MMRKEGDITFNGAPPNKNMKRNMGFVLQVRGGQLHPAANVLSTTFIHCFTVCRSHALNHEAVNISSWSSFLLCISFVQDDLMYESLTVFETLFYAAQLRLPRHMTLAQKKERVNTVITALGLDPCKDTIIGVRSWLSWGSAVASGCRSSHWVEAC